MPEDEKTYSLAEARAEITRQECERDGHPVVDNRDSTGSWARFAMYTPLPNAYYTGPNAVDRGPLSCKCCAYTWEPKRNPVGDGVTDDTAALQREDRPDLWGEQFDMLQTTLFEECETAGWDPEKKNSFGDETAHLHEEVSEAFRAFRKSHDYAIRYEADGKPQGVPIEHADVLIGLFYNAELHQYSLMEAVGIKHQWNLNRDYGTEGRRIHDRTTQPKHQPKHIYVPLPVELRHIGLGPDEQCLECGYDKRNQIHDA